MTMKKEVTGLLFIAILFPTKIALLYQFGHSKGNVNQMGSYQSINPTCVHTAACNNEVIVLGKPIPQ